MAQQELLKFEDAVRSLIDASNLDKKDLNVIRELEAAESYKSNWDRYQRHLANEEFTEALAYLVNKIPNNQHIKLMKVECLAKTG